MPLVDIVADSKLKQLPMQLGKWSTYWIIHTVYIHQPKLCTDCSMGTCQSVFCRDMQKGCLYVNVEQLDMKNKGYYINETN